MMRPVSKGSQYIQCIETGHNGRWFGAVKQLFVWRLPSWSTSTYRIHPILTHHGFLIPFLGTTCSFSSHDCVFLHKESTALAMRSSVDEEKWRRWIHMKRNTQSHFCTGKGRSWEGRKRRDCLHILLGSRTAEGLRVCLHSAVRQCWDSQVSHGAKSRGVKAEWCCAQAKVNC